MSAVEAKNQLVETMKAEAKTQAMSYISEVMDEARLTASKEAKRIVINTIQRIAPETAIENAVTVFNIERLKKEKEEAETALDTKYELMAQQFASYGVIINQMEASFSGLKMLIAQSQSSN